MPPDLTLSRTDAADNPIVRWWRTVTEDPVMFATDLWYKRPPRPVAELLRARLPAAEMTLGLQETATTAGPAGNLWLGVTHARVFLCAAAEDADPQWIDLGDRVEVQVAPSLLGRDQLQLGSWALAGPSLGGGRLRELANFAASSPARRFVDAGRVVLDMRNGKDALVLLNVALETLRAEKGERWSDAQRALLTDLVPLRAKAAAVTATFDALDDTLLAALDVYDSTALEKLGSDLSIARGVWIEALAHALFTAGRYSEARTRFGEITRHRPDLKPWRTWWVAHCDAALGQNPDGVLLALRDLRKTWAVDPVRIAPDDRDWMFETGRALPDVLLHLARALNLAGQRREALEVCEEALERAPLSAPVVATWIALHPDPAAWDARTARAWALHRLLTPSAPPATMTNERVEAASRGDLGEPVTFGPWLDDAQSLLLHPGVRGFFRKINQFIDRQFAAEPPTANLHFLFRPEGPESDGFAAAFDAARPLVDARIEIDPRMCANWYGVETRELPDGHFVLLLGHEHLKADHPRHLDAPAWTFLVTGQLALIRHNMALLGSEEYRNALTRTLIEYGPAAFGFVPVVGQPVEKGILLVRRWWGKGSRALNFLSRHTQNAVGRYWKATTGKKTGGGTLGKNRLAENALLSLCSADRYGLVATGNLHHAIRAMMLTSGPGSARAPLLGQRPLADLLDLSADVTESEAAELIQLQFRITELARFALSTDLDELLAAAAPSAT